MYIISPMYRDGSSLTAILSMCTTPKLSYRRWLEMSRRWGWALLTPRRCNGSSFSVPELRLLRTQMEETFTEDAICADTWETHGTWVSPLLLTQPESWLRYQGLSSYARLPEDRLLLQFLQWSDDDQVISIQVFPGTSCTKLLGGSFYNHNEQ